MTEVTIKPREDVWRGASRVRVYSGRFFYAVRGRTAEEQRMLQCD